MTALTAGTTLCDGRYRLDGVVGRGGMAVVWRASDLQLERDVAIKIISDVLAEDPVFVARFEREARLAAALNHPNLVKVFDFSVEDERPFLVMEYVAGGTLAEARGQTVLDVDALARDLLDAVAHIHAAGIVHRDIKPANVLLDDGGAPRLTDFGIARGEETSGLTQTGQVLGTLKYIAPEVAAGEPATVKSDLYALGILLGELSGSHSEAIATLIPRLTAREPADRPASATDALTELDPTKVLGPSEHHGGLAPYTPETFTSVRGQAPPFGRAQAVGGGLLLVAILAIVIAAASGGGDDAERLGVRETGTQAQAAPAGAPADQQIDRLEQIVRAAPRRR